MAGPKNGSKVAVIGLDVGGTKTAAGVVLFPEGKVLCRRVIPTNASRPGGVVLGEVVDLSKELVRQAADLGFNVCGIGVGIAELVDAEGNLASAHTINWLGLPVHASFAEVAPVFLESDVRAAAHGEALLGAGRQLRSFVYVSVGTGISCCLVQGGKPHCGAHGCAIVLATAPLSATCPSCGVHSHPILEEFASGPALRRRYIEAAKVSIQNGLEVTDMAERGDPDAIRVVQSGGEALGVVVGLVANILDPDAIIVGGGLGLDDRLYWQSMVESTRSHIWADSVKSLPILHAQLAADAGLIGAAASYWRQYQEPWTTPLERLIK